MTVNNSNKNYEVNILNTLEEMDNVDNLSKEMIRAAVRMRDVKKQAERMKAEAIRKEEAESKKWDRRLMYVVVAAMILVMVGSFMVSKMYPPTHAIPYEKVTITSDAVELAKTRNDYAQYKASMEDRMNIVTNNLSRERARVYDILQKFTDLTHLTHNRLQQYDYVISFIHTKVDAPYEDRMTISDIIYLDEMAKKYNVDPHLMLGMFKLESMFNTKATNDIQATGLGQFIPSTGKWIYGLIYGEEAAKYYSHATMAVDPRINIEMSCYYMRYLIDQHNGDIDEAMMAYNGHEIHERYPEVVREFLEIYGGIVPQANYR